GVFIMSSVEFFFSSRRRHTRFSRDWSSDVCSSDLTQRRKNVSEARPQGSLPFHGKKDDRPTARSGEARPRPGEGSSIIRAVVHRSEERRVGKEWRARGAAQPEKETHNRDRCRLTST